MKRKAVTTKVTKSRNGAVNTGYTVRKTLPVSERIIASLALKNGLKKHEGKIKNSKYEWQTIVDEKGDLVDTWTDHNPLQVRNLYVNKSYYKNHDNLINVHNHPPAYVGNVRIGQAPSPEDFINAEADKWMGKRVVEPYYTHIITPRNEDYGRHSNQFYFSLFNSLWNYYSKELQQRVNKGNITLRYYYNNLENIVAHAMAKELGWNYIIRKNVKDTGNLYKYKEEVIPPWELPNWLNVSRRNDYIKKWEKACEKYPELKKLKKGERLVKWVTPINID